MLHIRARNISKYLKPDKIDKLLPEVQAKVEQLLKSFEELKYTIGWYTENYYFPRFNDNNKDLRMIN